MKKKPRTKWFPPGAGFALSLLFFLLPFLGGGCAGAPPSPAPAAAGVPITQRGRMSTMVLALVERQNYIFDGERTHVHPGGLAFYFVVYPVSQRGTAPSIKGNQNFTVNGETYWRNSPGSYDSLTVIYNQETFAEREPRISAKIALKRDAKAFIQKTVICGLPLPAQGAVFYPLFFGYDQSLEEFDFRFDLKDVP